MAEWYLGLDSGYGYGYGDGYGYGYGYGYDGYGYDGYGYGDGSGYGYGSGDGSGDGYGDGYEILLSIESGFEMFHFIVKQGDKYLLRNGKICSIGEDIHEPEIRMCERGLHASFTPLDARQYAPNGSVLTKVLVWGRVIINKDKVCATNRKIICEVAE